MVSVDDFLTCAGCGRHVSYRMGPDRACPTVGNPTFRTWHCGVWYAAQPLLLPPGSPCGCIKCVPPVQVPRALLDRVAGLLERLEWGKEAHLCDAYCPYCGASEANGHGCELAEVRAAVEKVRMGCA